MAHYFDENPVSPEKSRFVPLSVEGRDYVFETAGGVFSGDHVDKGSRLLIETVIRDLRTRGVREGKLLDLGCGYGPVGIVLKRTFPGLDVSFLDINRRALQLAEKNAKQNQVSFSRFILADGFVKTDETFDFILTNPPIRAGKKVVYAFFDGALKHLNENGALYVVMQKKQGAPSATTYLTDRFGVCDMLEREAGYRVLRCYR